MSQEIPSGLQKIIEEKYREVAERKNVFSIDVLENMISDDSFSPRGFYQALHNKVEQGENAVIAEIKKASPSTGIIRKDFDPVTIAQDYEASGAACLSVLTDEKFFHGSEHYLHDAREATCLPVIRKDVIIDEYQVYESRAMGADCILLIAACLCRETMLKFTTLAYELGLDVLIEVHNMAELEKVAGLPIRMLGINNRDLSTFAVDLHTTIDLSQLIPPHVLVVTESGIGSREDVNLMNANGIHAFLIGELFMRQEHPGTKLRELFL